VSLNETRTCRLCKEQDGERHLVKYGVRQYAHGRCLIANWSFGRLVTLHDWQIAGLPWLAVEETFTAEEVAELRGRIERHLAEVKERQADGWTFKGVSR
jgi:hypothetical protein